MEENMTKSAPLALTIFLSVLGSLVVVGSVLYIARDAISQQLFLLIKSDVESLIPPPALLQSDDQRIRSAIAAVNPAVVSVIVTKDVPVYERYYETYDPWGWFGGFTIPRVRENGTEEQQVGAGSGFIVSSDGMIVTNRHVVSDEEARYSIVLNDGTIYDAVVLARDTQLDIAVLKIDEVIQTQLTVARFGDSSQLELGQTVIAIGNALAEFQNSVSVGVVSGLSRSIVASDSMGNAEQLNQVIQTDAAINPGNSGGPLVSLSGEVVGVNVATSRGADNIGFALPSSLVSQVVTSVAETGTIVRPYLGVRYQMLDETQAQERGLPVSYGALLTAPEGVVTIEENSPADAAGLQAEDVIITIDGVPLRNSDLATELRTKRVGDTITLEVWRSGEILTLTATLATLE